MGWLGGILNIRYGIFAWFTMRKYPLLLFCFWFKIAYTQTVEVLNKSGYQHEYIIKDFEYLEDINDTNKLKYIATLRVVGKTHHLTGTVVRWAVKMQETAKKLGANAFCLKEYTEKDSMGTLILNVYFVGENYLKINREKADKDNIYLFGAKSNALVDSTYFYFNENKINFEPAKNYLMKTSLNTIYNIAVTKNKTTNISVIFKKEGKSRYFIIPNDKSEMVWGKPHRNPANKGSAGASEASFLGSGVMGIYLLASHGANTPIEIPYKYGKFMKDIWK